MIISQYGLHWAQGDIAFLVQAKGAVNLISDNLASPFTVNTVPRRAKCPHLIDLDAVVDPPAWASHPAAAYFMPVPRTSGEKPRLLHDPEGRHEAQLKALVRLCSPIIPVTRPTWFGAGMNKEEPYRVTNLGPLIWVGAETGQTPVLRRQMGLGLAYNRRVVFVSVERIPLFGEVEALNLDDLPDLSQEPMEAIGAGVLRKFMGG